MRSIYIYIVLEIHFKAILYLTSSILYLGLKIYILDVTITITIRLIKKKNFYGVHIK